MTSSVPQITTISNKQFLQSIFTTALDAVHCTGFPQDPKDGHWRGDVWYRTPLINPDYNNFFVISTFYPDQDGTHRRRKNNFAAAYCLMIDDIGWGAGAKISWFRMSQLGFEPSWVLETSPGNFQWGWIFKRPVKERGKIEALLKGLVGLGLVDDGTDPGMLGCTRYARLPVGSNTKKKYGKVFSHHLHQWHPDKKYDIDELAKSFDLNLNNSVNPDAELLDFPPKEEDTIYQSLDRLGLVKGEIRPGVYDIHCPWLHEHDGDRDDGSAYMAPKGFKCHHGHCQTRTGKDLMNHLHGADPVYAEACKMPFEPVTEDQTTIVPLETALTALTDEIEAALDLIVEHEMSTSTEAYRALAAALTRLSPEQKEYYIQEIKRRSGRAAKVVRDQLAYTRTQILKAHREQGILHEPAWKEYHGDNIVASVQNVTAMCEYHGIRVRYNEMSHGVDCDIPGAEFAPDDVANLNLTYIRDLMVGYGLPYTRADEFMNTIAHEYSYHPFRDYLESVKDLPFDPSLPMFEKLMSTLTITHDEDAARTFVRRWFTSVVAAVKGHAGIGMKGVLTFSGKQGIGKTSWFRGIVDPSMFREGLILDPHNKDSLIAATEHLICEIGELDATFKKDIPAIKAFISNQSDKIRHPYAAKTSRHARMTVFCATVNEMDFLVDSTGNTRFWPIAVDNCDFRAIKKMKESGQIDLLWREFYELYQAAITGVDDAKWWVGQEDNKWLHESSEAFTKEAPGEVLLRKHYDMDSPTVHWVTSTELTESLGLDPTDHGFVTRRTEVLAALRRITGQHVRKTFRREDLLDDSGKQKVNKGYLVPQRMLQKMKAQLSVVPSVAKPAESEFDFI